MVDYVLTGLVKRRAELAGEIEALRARLAQIGIDLGHLDAVIRPFDPEYELASICPKRPRGPDVAGRGERSRALLAVLREAGVSIGLQRGLSAVSGATDCPDQAACKTRARSRSCLARPYICRLISLSRVI